MADVLGYIPGVGITEEMEQWYIDNQALSVSCSYEMALIAASVIQQATNNPTNPISPEHRQDHLKALQFASDTKHQSGTSPEHWHTELSEEENDSDTIKQWTDTPKYWTDTTKRWSDTGKHWHIKLSEDEDDSDIDEGWVDEGQNRLTQINTKGTEWCILGSVIDSKRVD